jgi:hypothetical protein
MRNAAMLNGRITREQMDWLEARAEALGGNLSAALRQAITDARLLEGARDDYKLLCDEHPEFEIPRHDDDRTTRFVQLVLGMTLTDVDDQKLRDEEASA